MKEGRTLSPLVRANRLKHIVTPCEGSGFEGLGWVRLGRKGACQGPLWSCMRLYISCTPTWDH